MSKKERIEIDDLFRIKTISRVEWQNADSIMIEELSMNRSQNDYNSVIYHFEPKSKSLKQYTMGLTKDSSLKLSFTRDKMAFLSNRLPNNKPQLFIMDLSGGEGIKYTSLPNGIISFAWSLDGKKIVLVHSLNMDEMREEDEQEKEDEKKAYNELEEKIKKLTKEEREKQKVEPRIIKKIVYRKGTSYLTDRYQQVYLLDIESKKVKRITSSEANYFSPVLSKDNSKIYACKHLEKGSLNDEAYYALVEIDVKTKAEKEIKRFYSYDPSVVISSNGKYLIHHFSRTKEQLSMRNLELNLINLETREEDWFTENYDNHAFMPKFSTDNQTVYFVSHENEKSVLYAYAIETKEIKKIISSDFMLYSYDVLEDKVALNVSTASDPSVVMVYNMESKELEEIYASNQKWLKDKILAETTEIKYSASVPDIQGWIVKPPNFKEKKKYPLIVEIHGGPHATWSPYERTMWFEFQYFAANDYVIFYCNPKGSSGRGEDFRNVFRDWGETPANDILTGVNQVMNYPFIDKESLYITGGSYGGYMTTWIIGHDQRFKAAVPQRGVYNLISFWSTTDITNFTYNEMGAFPWNNLELLWEQSPIAYVANIKTPTRIVHSENDFRVPISQAEELYASLLKLGVEAEFIRYPEEGHELSRSGKPKRRKDRLEKILEWFNTH